LPAAAWRVRKQTYGRGDSVLRADSRGGGLGLVVQGQLAVLANPSATRPLVVLTPGLTFGQRAAAIRPADATLKALTACEIWFVQPAALEAMAPAEPSRAQKRERTSPWGLLGLLLLIVLAVAVLALPDTQAELAALPMGLGDWCHRQGDTWCAGQAWMLAGRMAPLDASPLLALGNQALERNDLDAAEQRFEQARTADSDSPEAYNNLGAVYFRRGEYSRAVAAFEQALLLEPGSAATEQNLADCLLAMHAFDEALGHYQAAQSLGGSGDALLANIAIAYYQVGHPAEALDLLYRARAQAGTEETQNLIDRHLATIRAETGDSDVP
jgi:Flp pilus assembly protein TadD